MLHCDSGTHGYMAPEVITKGLNYTYTADWFSFGCVCYKLVKGLVSVYVKTTGLECRSGD